MWFIQFSQFKKKKKDCESVGSDHTTVKSRSRGYSAMAIQAKVPLEVSLPTWAELGNKSSSSPQGQ